MKLYKAKTDGNYEGYYLDSGVHCMFLTNINGKWFIGCYETKLFMQATDNIKWDYIIDIDNEECAEAVALLCKKHELKKEW